MNFCCLIFDIWQEIKIQEYHHRIPGILKYTRAGLNFLTEVYFLGFSWWSKRKGSRKAQKAWGGARAQAPSGDVATFGDSLNNAEIKWSRKVPFGAPNMALITTNDQTNNISFQKVENDQSSKTTWEKQKMKNE